MPSNIYNMDEKGFLIGICNSMKRIVSLQALLSKKLLGACQDGSREFLSLIATICADGTALPPALIYQGGSGDLQNSWLEDFDHSQEEAYFAASPKGWTNEKLGVSWLTGLFEKHTKRKAGFRKRLLIVDGHNSHVNMRFIEACDERSIILAILPPHATHRLQPLDLKIFSPLSMAYSLEIDRIIQSSQGFTRLTKRSFWSLFRTAWKKAVSEHNVCSAFASAAIHPLDPSLVLSQVRLKTPSPELSDEKAPTKTPAGVRSIRRHVKALGPLNNREAQLANGWEKTTIKNEILHHENQGLREALRTEQKRRKRGKKMGLLAGDEPGQAMFFSPGRIATVREQAAALEAQKEQERLDKAREKQAKATERERKAQEVQERRERRQIEAAERKALREREKEDRHLQSEASKQLRCEAGALKEPWTRSTTIGKRRLAEDREIETTGMQGATGRYGRLIKRPRRLE